MSQWSRARVNIDYHIAFDANFYSVPYTLVQELMEVRATPTTVEIFHKGQRVASANLFALDNSPGSGRWQLAYYSVLGNLRQHCTTNHSSTRSLNGFSEFGFGTVLSHFFLSEPEFGLET
jgi:hypothetical protein